MRSWSIVAALLIVLATSGCGTIGKVLSPYPEGPPCKMKQNGKCQSVSKTYDDSVNGFPIALPPEQTAPQAAPERGGAALLANASTEERPLVEPAKVLHIRIWPYVARNGVLYGTHDVWVILSQPKFAMGAATAEK